MLDRSGHPLAIALVTEVPALLLYRVTLLDIAEVPGIVGRAVSFGLAIVEREACRAVDMSGSGRALPTRLLAVHHRPIHLEPQALEHEYGRDGSEEDRHNRSTDPQKTWPDSSGQPHAQPVAPAAPAAPAAAAAAFCARAFWMSANSEATSRASVKMFSFGASSFAYRSK